MKTVHLHTLGFPRMGAQRELKFALERYWRFPAEAAAAPQPEDGRAAARAALEATGRTLRARHWAVQAEAGLDFVTVGDFAFYDHVLNHIQLFGCVPARFGCGAAAAAPAHDLDQAFTLARGATAAVVEAAGPVTHGGPATAAAAPAHSAAAAPCGCGAGHGDASHAALEMTKWFDTNYHYLVPEFDAATTFTLAPQRLLSELAEARALGHRVKLALIGPLTFLWLGKMTASAVADVGTAVPAPAGVAEAQAADAASAGGAPSADRLALLERLLPVYTQLLAELKRAGAEWVQIDEPILGLDLPPAWRNAFEPAYWQLSQSGAQLLLATYFSPLEENLSLACRLPVAGLHVDGVRAPHELASVADWLPVPKVLSVGIVDGRNIWRTDLHAALATLEPLLAKRQGALWLAPSCSLLHVPFSLHHETRLDAELRSWLACATEKLAELSALRSALLDPAVATAGDVPRATQHDLSPQPATSAPSHQEHTGDVPRFAEHERSAQSAAARAFAASAAALASRGRSARVHDAAVQAACTQAAADPLAHCRSAPFAERAAAQQQRLQLPAYPTTTIGSFPQTAAIRAARAAHRRGELSAGDYARAMQTEIAHVIQRQEELGLDVLVHGEAERNDMVEYFGEQLQGFAFTDHGWVQSYGSRCVKPPIIYGDVHRPQPMTVAWARYAQQLTRKPVKGMLTGPITLLQWSFVRADQPRSRTALQLALAIRAEVQDLEQAGIAIIQVDEPALREGLPLRRARQPDYLDWATRAFRLATAGAAARTQIHTHMCYAEFGDILPAIAALDADVITIEASRSGLTLLGDLQRFRYPNAVGPGVFDIHSPRVPAAAAIADLLRSARRALDVRQLWVNPDCGLKTRAWPETAAALQNMVAAARQLRAEHIGCPE